MQPAFSVFQSIQLICEGHEFPGVIVDPTVLEPPARIPPWWACSDRDAGRLSAMGSVREKSLGDFHVFGIEPFFDDVRSELMRDARRETER